MPVLPKRKLTVSVGVDVSRGTRIRLTIEKEALIQQLHAEGKLIAAIARLVGLSHKSAYKALGQKEEAP